MKTNTQNNNAERRDGLNSAVWALVGVFVVLAAFCTVAFARANGQEEKLPVNTYHSTLGHVYAVREIYFGGHRYIVAHAFNTNNQTAGSVSMLHSEGCGCKKK